MELFFTSDWHLDHKNIIRYENRPFDDVESMNWKIIDNFNKKVSKNDKVYFLGDFAFTSNLKRLWEYAEQLKGKWTFIVGNHDYTFKLKQFFQLFSNNPVYDLLTIKYQKEQITLCHYPMHSWPSSHHGSWHLYGHIHSRPISHQGKLMMNVGVDVNYFWPVSFTEVKEYMNKQNTK